MDGLNGWKNERVLDNEALRAMVYILFFDDSSTLYTRKRCLRIQNCKLEESC